MTVILIEGFEQLDTTEGLDAGKFQYLFQAMQPDVVSPWLTDDTGCSINCVSGGRVANNCLRFVRSAGTETFKDVYGINLGFAFGAKDKVSVGFAVKFDEVPTESIPLLVGRYDNGAVNEEQFSLWVTTAGRLFFSSTDYQASYDTMLPPAAIAGGMSLFNAVRFTVWNYIEVTMDYSGATPIAQVFLNGMPVIENFESGNLKKMTDNFLSAIHFINPANQHFGAGFTQYLDDIYINDDDAFGPQQVIPLVNGTSVQLGTWSGIPDSGGYAAADTPITTSGGGTTPAIWNLSDVSGIGAVNGIGINIILDVATGIAGVSFGVRGSGTNFNTRNITLTEDDPVRCFRHVMDNLPSPNGNDEAGVNALRGQLARRLL